MGREWRTFLETLGRLAAHTLRRRVRRHQTRGAPPPAASTRSSAGRIPGRKSPARPSRNTSARGGESPRAIPPLRRAAIVTHADYRMRATIGVPIGRFRLGGARRLLWWAARMEPLTHFFTGACMGRAGFNRKTAYATLAATLAAEAARSRYLLGLSRAGRGAEAPSRHYPHLHWRPLRCGGYGRLRSGCCIAGTKSAAVASSSAANLSPGEPLPLRLQPRPVHWGWLYLTCFIAALTHIALDWTNNYGVRPFFPFNPRWYEGSFMFIAEPVLWGLFLIGFHRCPGCSVSTDREIGARRTRFRGRGWAIFALAGMAVAVASGDGPNTTRPAPCSRTPR